MSKRPTDKPEGSKSSGAKDSLARRRAEALRANLRRRKDQARARDAVGATDPPENGVDEGKAKPDETAADATRKRDGNGD